MGKAGVGQDSSALSQAKPKAAAGFSAHAGRPAMLLAGLAAITLFQFLVFPGHSWLTAQTSVPDTKLYVPMIERLGAPGLLSRDLVATHPTVAYTVYDEAALFVRKVLHVDFRRSLAIQQFAFRFAAVTGVFLLARAARLSRAFSLATALLANFGSWVPGVGVALSDPDPAPYAFALCAVILAAGLLATSRPLSAGLAGGIALLYDLRIAAPFWIVVILAAIINLPSRRLMRASLPVFVIFMLLLGNLAQLQPGVTEPQMVWGRIPAAIAMIRRFRSPELWIRSWHWPALAASLLVAGFCAGSVLRLWRRLDEPARWMFVGLPLGGFLSLPLSFLLLDWMRSEAIPLLQPAVLLLLPLAFCAIGCAIAGLHALNERRWREMALLLAVVALLPLISPARQKGRDMDSVSTWALANTWGGSMFLFPDAGRASDPAVFRAKSKRAVWVDWDTGKLANASESFADEWFRRWQDTMAGEYSTGRLARLLSLPIDYYVLQRDHVLTGVGPVFTDGQFVVYDANDLRKATVTLR
jgi:hypothetical protein